MTVYTDGESFYHKCKDKKLEYFTAFYRLKNESEFITCFNEEKNNCKIKIPLYFVILNKINKKSGFFLTDTHTAQVFSTYSFDYSKYKELNFEL